MGSHRILAVAMKRNGAVWCAGIGCAVILLSCVLSGIGYRDYSLTCDEYDSDGDCVQFSPEVFYTSTPMLMVSGILFWVGLFVCIGGLCCVCCLPSENTIIIAHHQQQPNLAVYSQLPPGGSGLMGAPPVHAMPAYAPPVPPGAPPSAPPAYTPAPYTEYKDEKSGNTYYEVVDPATGERKTQWHKP